MSQPIGFRGRRIPGSVRTREQLEQLRRTTNVNSLNLSPRSLQIYQENPHLQQVFLCQKPLIQQDIFTESDRIVDLNCPIAVQYQRRTGEPKTVIHNGQRKLLAVEVEFLTRVSLPGDIVIYAGAAPGYHQDILGQLFPFLHFVLYDPRHFRVEATSNRELHQEFFSDFTAQMLASKYRDQRILFLSDIRRYEETLPDDQLEELIREDMEAQLTWLHTLNPVASLLKFRPPYGRGTINYVIGKIFYQPWAGPTSSEARLFVTDRFSRKIYDYGRYEDLLYYYNTVLRPTYYCSSASAPPTAGAAGGAGCHCYDCIAEKFIYQEYVNKYGGSVEEIIKYINTNLFQGKDS